MNARRSPAQKKLDERAFPVRLRFRVPPSGFGNRLVDVDIWLDRHVGRAECARHSDEGCLAIYFRTPAAAAALVEAFPDFELADGTQQAWYSTPRRPPTGSDRHRPGE